MSIEKSYEYFTCQTSSKSILFADEGPILSTTRDSVKNRCNSNRQTVNAECISNLRCVDQYGRN